MTEYSWIKTELLRRFPKADFSQGVDLNRNGRLEESERLTDSNRNGFIGDRSDWQAFLKKNSSPIQSLGGIFKWGSRFDPKNPIHDLLSVESELVKPDEIHKSYQILSKILEKVKKEILGKELSPQEKVQLVYKIIESLEIKFDEQNDPLFARGINKRRLDCDLSSFVVMAVGYELKWPVYLVRAPDHIFVRWEDNKNQIRFNVDFGKITTDDYYRQWTDFSKEAEQNGVYLKNLTEDEKLGLFLENRGRAKFDLSDNKGALEDFNRVIELNPQYAANTYRHRGDTRFALGDLEGAREDYDRAIELNPKDAYAYHNRGNVKFALSDKEGARKDYDRAIELNPKDAYSYCSRGDIKFALSDKEGARKDYDRAIERNPKYAYAYNSRGFTKFVLGDKEGALSDSNLAIKFNSKNAGFYLNRSIIKREMKDFKGSKQDFRKYQELSGSKNP